MSSEQDIHKQITDAIDGLRDDIKELRKEVAPVVEWFSNINFAKKLGMGFLKFIAFLVTLAFTIKQLFFK